MAFNTIKSTLGFLATLVNRYTPIQASADSLDDIFNYLEIDERISTSGQPTEKQFALIKAHGFAEVINLAPHDAENSLKDETGTLAGLGLNYTHIPVNFKRPRDSDFDAFTAAMAERADQKVWVHCAANMRVSAFIYRYRCTVLGEPADEAKQDLDKIWQPMGVWKQFAGL